jgi:hypothetical protein
MRRQSLAQYALSSKDRTLSLVGLTHVVGVSGGILQQRRHVENNAKRELNQEESHGSQPKRAYQASHFQITQEHAPFLCRLTASVSRRAVTGKLPHVD